MRCGTTSGTRLATLTFTNEKASGWVRSNFSTPVPIKAGTTYIASYHTDTGHYYADTHYFDNKGAGYTHVKALKAGVDGPNGVYSYGPANTFPKSNWYSANYWVDVMYIPDMSTSTTISPAGGDPTTTAAPTTTKAPTTAPPTTAPPTTTTTKPPTTTTTPPTTTPPPPSTSTCPALPKPTPTSPAPGSPPARPSRPSTAISSLVPRDRSSNVSTSPGSCNYAHVTVTNSQIDGPNNNNDPVVQVNGNNFTMTHSSVGSQVDLVLGETTGSASTAAAPTSPTTSSCTSTGPSTSTVAATPGTASCSGTTTSMT